MKEFLDAISDFDRAAIVAAMKESCAEGLRVARHIEGDVYEIRATGLKAHYRLLFAAEARFIFLAIDIFDKDTQKLPPQIKRRALERLRDWRSRGSA